MKNITVAILIGLFLLITINNGLAALSAEEADRLGKDLTPLGAEKAGNAEGTIPEWKGGLTKPLEGWPNEDNYRPNPHSDDKILFAITKENMQQYADKLPEAAKAMLIAYPKAFKMNIYPTRRTAAFPQWYYDAIKKNATTATLINDGDGVEGVWGSIPFPIPQNGHEVIWNHLMRFQGITKSTTYNESLVFANGSRLEYLRDCIFYYPFYDTNVSDKDRNDGVFLKYSHTTVQPSRDAGDGLMALDNINPAKFPRKGWQYDPGERRVRRAPNLGFDTPDLPLTTLDDFDIFNGSPERYDWKLVGKKEMYVPYNNNEVNSPRRDLKESTPAGFLSSEIVRYELHRVWVVEATVKKDKRHIYAKRVFYIDEDSWNPLVLDKYDNSGKLWRVTFVFPLVASEYPLTGAGSYVQVDLKKNAYLLTPHTFGTKGWDFTQEPPSSKFFTPAALRRRGR